MSRAKTPNPPVKLSTFGGILNNFLGLTQMRRALIILAAIACSTSAPAAESEAQDELKATVRTLQFIADVSIYEGYFVSVVEFCRQHVPPEIIQGVDNTWRHKNATALELRDKEVLRLHRAATAAGAKKDKLDELMVMPERYRTRAIKQDRMVQDLRQYDDLMLRCSTRLGEMLSNSMRMEAIVPNANAYMLTR